MTAVIPTAGVIFAGTYAEDSPAAGLEAALKLFAHAEELGFDVAGIRQRHLERGVSGALAFLAAATQRTDSITLESAVVPLGHETPFRVAEDAALVDALAGGRLHLGVSTSRPHDELLTPYARPVAGHHADPYAAVERLLRALEGMPLSDDPLPTPSGPQIPRIQPHAPGLRGRVWLGGGSLRSVRWAAENGLRLLLGNVGDGDAAPTFEHAQRIHLDEYHERFAGGERAVGVERVVIPVDSATASQREHYAAYTAAREERTHRPVLAGDRRLVFGRDLHGTVAEIADRLSADEVFDGRTQLRVSLPYGFTVDEYRQILGDIRHGLLPVLGWRPSTVSVH
ncbi:LLM class flavin-dependent oxidoreductase [Microbacterium sp. EYE_5]|uniref:LLM class flavin-dependent oxidoreductase n=1 Tax=unclassified Microbacterium TaxID=2609290 RepID=UPI002006CB02|nr:MULTISPECIES: LLM class flavin-dependent oxidoreductase [unclassified Microbacterium]MCK6080007.1 LLM class flavin-dependent oxidoreductase [Microbacterium sp. EYE_382]MCK6085278.1 LLM class flavin-dependent oxidoreductase [Microbacterium sp. EYE_384]MCK6122497.1 LLM class flavin-dependent oxidoreductase [Microbacterium sp. EYE_80]MCK6126041.1 LLM class flavin-dependent oxidoreductase [Microbacterium sp. EYE_79]MCK6140962.1 LLM class flavin-dependent oxidoreductase [Microbacterium sp. EYE_3